MLGQRWLRRKKSQGRYREGKEAGCEEAEEYSALTNGLIRGISGSFWTRSLYDRSPRGHIDKRETQGRDQIKKERMRSERLDRGTWSAFWLAILGNAIDFLSIFFVCDSNSCILIKTSRVRGKGQAILPLTFSSALELKSELEQT